LFVAVSATPIRVRIAQAIPPNLRVAAAAGIGIFLTFIGLKNAGFIVSDPVTFVKLGVLDRAAQLSLLGLAPPVLLLNRKSPFAFLGGIFLPTAAARLLGLIQTPRALVRAPDFSSVFLKLDPIGALKPALWPAVISILFTDLFDSISTFIGVAHAGGLL